MTAAAGSLLALCHLSTTATVCMAQDVVVDCVGLLIAQPHECSWQAAPHHYARALTTTKWSRKAPRIGVDIRKKISRESQLKKHQLRRCEHRRKALMQQRCKAFGVFELLSLGKTVVPMVGRFESSAIQFFKKGLSSLPLMKACFLSCIILFSPLALPVPSHPLRALPPFLRKPFYPRPDKCRPLRSSWRWASGLRSKPS